MTPPEETPAAAGEAGPRRRLWTVVVVAVIVGFVALVVSSIRDSAVPVGTSGGMAGMPGMGGGEGMEMKMRDVDGRALSVPGGAPGLAVFAEARNCEDCVRSVAAADRAVRRVGRGKLTVVMVSAATVRSDVARFAARAGSPRARYVIDDRNGSVSSMFDAESLGVTVAYDAAGKIVGRARTEGQMRRALERAAGEG